MVRALVLFDSCAVDLDWLCYVPMIHIGGDQRIHVIITVSVVIPVAILVIIFGVLLLHVGPQIWVTRIECDLEMNALVGPARQEEMRQVVEHRKLRLKTFIVGCACFVTL